MIFVDTNVFMYAVGRPHPLQADALQFFDETATMRGELATEIASAENRLIKWMVAQMIAAIVAASSIALLVQQLFGG